jgi:hypothetical protein
MRTPVLAAALLCAAALDPLRSDAAEANRLAALARASDAVVQAICVRTESAWDPTGRIIITRAELRTDRVFVGQAAAQPLTVQTLGGQVGDIRMGASHGATVTTGESAVFFLQRRDDHTYVVAGGSDGKLPVVATADGTRIRVGRRLLAPEAFASELREVPR